MPKDNFPNPIKPGQPASKPKPNPSSGSAPTDPSERVSDPKLTDPSTRVSGKG